MSLTYYISWCLMSCSNGIPRYHWCQIAAASLQISLMSMTIFVPCHSVSRVLASTARSHKSSLRTHRQAQAHYSILLISWHSWYSPGNYSWNVLHLVTSLHLRVCGGGTWDQILQTGLCLTPVNTPQWRISVTPTTGGINDNKIPTNILFYRTVHYFINSIWIRDERSRLQILHSWFIRFSVKLLYKSWNYHHIVCYLKSLFY